MQVQAQKEKQKQAKESSSVTALSEMEPNKNAEVTNKSSTTKTDVKMGVTPLKNYHPLIGKIYIKGVTGAKPSPNVSCQTLHWWM